MAQYRITFPGSMTRTGEPAIFETNDQVSDYMIGQMQDIGEDVIIERIENNWS